MRASELRLIALPAEARLLAGSDVASGIDGYGARFNEETVIAGMYRERFLPGSLAESFRNDDILVTFNHDMNCLLGRKSNATATFVEDDFGGKYSVSLNQTDPDAQRVGAKVQRRDVSGSSVLFKVERPEDEEWTRDASSPLPLRTIKRAKVIEMGPVSRPYYVDTTASARSQAESVLAEAAAMIPPAPAVGAVAAEPSPQRRVKMTLGEARAYFAEVSARCCSYCDTERDPREEFLRACRWCISDCASCLAACAVMASDAIAGAASVACRDACQACIDACSECLTALKSGDQSSADAAMARCQSAFEAAVSAAIACALVCARMSQNDDAQQCVWTCQSCVASCLSVLGLSFKLMPSAATARAADLAASDARSARSDEDRARELRLARARSV